MIGRTQRVQLSIMTTANNDASDRFSTANMFREYFRRTPDDIFCRFLPLSIRSLLDERLSKLFDTLRLPSRLENVIVLGGFNSDAEIFAITDYFVNHHGRPSHDDSGSKAHQGRLSWSSQIISLTRGNEVCQASYKSSFFVILYFDSIRETTLTCPKLVSTH